MDSSDAAPILSKLGYDIDPDEIPTTELPGTGKFKKARRTTLWRRLVLAILSSIVLFLLISLIATIVPIWRREGQSVTVSSSPLEYLVKWETILFEPINDTTAEITWDCLPNGNGLTYLNDGIKEEFNLPPGLPDGSGGSNLYGISWTHQLYCLSILRTALTDALAGSAADDPSIIAHFFDCFEYLRKKISCNPDLTIEYPTGDDPIIDGWGMHHQCAQRMPLGVWIVDHHPEKLQNFTGYGTVLKTPDWAKVGKHD
ncbi:hypothetical protein F5Y10DRAFT_266648 [Nemania abortiva]|nr:hypothetical protein F5Y10DRAFT_266648 [Nemania abortiva]